MHPLLFVLVLALTPAEAGTAPDAATAQQVNKAARVPAIRFTMINMSGKDREAHVRNRTIPLPVGTSVAVQVFAGDSVKITSSMDREVHRVMVMTAAEQGHVVPVD